MAGQPSCGGVPCHPCIASSLLPAHGARPSGQRTALLKAPAALAMVAHALLDRQLQGGGASSR